ncbi:MAG: hypothetical protein PVF76_17155, partial [Syntrophobacterales bacterium]
MKRLSKRTSEEAKKEYERQWLDALSFIQREKVSGNENIIQILEHYDKQSVRRFFSSKFFHDIHKRLGLSLKRKQPPTERLAVLDGAYIIAPIDLTFNNYLIDILAKFLFKMGDQIDCVVELGSGIGRKLIALAHQLDPELRKRLMFYACEFTTAGREACAALQELNSDIRISIEPFDYYQPDFSFLPENKNVLCFTSHSIEQIPILNRRVFEEIIAMTDRCYCYHAEPVGWQYLEDLRGHREQMRAKA